MNLSCPEKRYTDAEALAASTLYFDGDELAAHTFVSKYALRRTGEDGASDLLEREPGQMHRRLAREFARIERRYPAPVSEEEIFRALAHFRELVPQGSPMYGIGNDYSQSSLSNCFAGSEKILTRDQGVQSLIDLVAEPSLMVLTQRGWKEATIRSFGKQRVQRITFAPAIPTSLGNGWRKLSSNERRVITATPDHRWELTSGYVTSSLQVENTVKACVLPITETKGIDYRKGFTHGVVFGDGSYTYTSLDGSWKSHNIRLCGKKSCLIAQLEVVTVSYPSYAEGDPCCYIRSPFNLKELPSSGMGVDYWSGFIAGLLATDGMQTKEGTWSISTQNSSLITWIKEYAPYGGYLVTGEVIYPEDTNYGKRSHPLHILRLRNAQELSSGWKVVSIEPLEELEVVFCAVVPDEERFTLAGGIYTLNCVVIPSPRDSVSGILEAGKMLANLYKNRCGVGMALDTLRPEGARVANAAGTSTGAWSFADFFSYVTRMIGQNGRRGALMLTMDVRHPDIEQFIVMKRDLTRVTGANVSVMLSDEFMRAVEVDQEWLCHWPIDAPLDQAKVVRKTSARALWRLINESAHASAEPGLLFWDNYLRNCPAEGYPGFASVTVNPCSELVLSALDACRLISINLTGFVEEPFTPRARWNMPLFRHRVWLAMRLMDDLVDLEIEKLEGILSRIDEEDEREIWRGLLASAKNGRRTGLGTHGLADALAMLNLRYDSEPALTMTGNIFEMLRNESYAESVRMARERGPFPLFDPEKEQACAFLQRLPAAFQQEMRRSGRRNIALLTNAPTGSVAILSQTSSGIEPVFQNLYTRRKKINPSDPLTRTDFVDELGDHWQEYPVFHPGIERYLQAHAATAGLRWETIQAHEPPLQWGRLLQELLPPQFVTSSTIDPMRRVAIQGVIQSMIDHGVSSSINLPKETTVEQVEEIYLAAWKHGLKGVTVYRDGSRSGVLVTAKTDAITPVVAPARRETLPCHLHKVTVRGEKWLILVGLLDGKPYEVFGGRNGMFDFGDATCFEIKKVRTSKGSRYDLIFDDVSHNGGWMTDVVSHFDDHTYGVITRMISMSLRHGVPVAMIVDQLRHDQESDLYSFSRVLARVLKGYITNGAVSSERCANCGEKLRFEGGCALCLSPTCGYSKCS